MTAVAVTGNGPFEFTNSDGDQVSIPLTAFSFDASGNLVVNANWQAITSADPAKALLAYARTQGLIVPAVAPSPKPAAIIKAVSPGSAGNNIVVSIQNIGPTPASPDPTKTTFDIVVTETGKYTGLTDAATLQSRIGTATVAGSQPGLVHISNVAKPAGFPAALTQILLAGGGPGVKASLAISDGTDTIFTIEARDPGVDGNLIEITIIVNTTVSPATFDLMAQWTKSVTGVTIGTFQFDVAKVLGYEITAAAPAGGVFSVPTGVTTNLNGGGGSTNASAILVANQ
jgi:hypothetical protein